MIYTCIYIWIAPSTLEVEYIHLLEEYHGHLRQEHSHHNLEALPSPRVFGEVVGSMGRQLT